MQRKKALLLWMTKLIPITTVHKQYFISCCHSVSMLLFLSSSFECTRLSTNSHRICFSLFLFCVSILRRLRSRSRRRRSHHHATNRQCGRFVHSYVHHSLNGVLWTTTHISILAPIYALLFNKTNVYTIFMRLFYWQMDKFQYRICRFLCISWKSIRFFS